MIARGFAILGRNVRVGALELDILARNGGLAVVVEVRTRGAGSFSRGLASIDAKKRVSLARAAERVWQRTLSKMSEIERLRIDVAAVTFSGDETRVEYIEGALTA